MIKSVVSSDTMTPPSAVTFTVFVTVPTTINVATAGGATGRAP